MVLAKLVLVKVVFGELDLVQNVVFQVLKSGVRPKDHVARRTVKQTEETPMSGLLLTEQQLRSPSRTVQDHFARRAGFVFAEQDCLVLTRLRVGGLLAEHPVVRPSKRYFRDY